MQHLKLKIASNLVCSDFNNIPRINKKTVSNRSHFYILHTISMQNRIFINGFVEKILFETNTYKMLILIYVYILFTNYIPIIFLPYTTIFMHIFVICFQKYSFQYLFQRNKTNLLCEKYKGHLLLKGLKSSKLTLINCVTDG